MTRREALKTLEEGQTRLEELVERLSDEEQVRSATIGGGEWSAKDLIGHIAFVEEIALVTIEAWLRGHIPPIEEIFTAGGTDEQNRWNQERKRSWSLERVREGSEETHCRLISAIQTMTEEQWNLPRVFEGDEREDLGSELGDVLGAPGRPFGHAFAHLPDLEAYVRSIRSRN